MRINMKGSADVSFTCKQNWLPVGFVFGRADPSLLRRQSEDVYQDGVPMKSFLFASWFPEIFRVYFSHFYWWHLWIASTGQTLRLMQGHAVFDIFPQTKSNTIGLTLNKLAVLLSSWPSDQRRVQSPDPVWFPLSDKGRHFTTSCLLWILEPKKSCCGFFTQECSRGPQGQQSRGTTRGDDGTSPHKIKVLNTQLMMF